jgi:hypothetical protein
MQLSAITVDWEKLERLRNGGELDEMLWHSELALCVGDPPWPSDSTIQFGEIAECYESIKHKLSEPTRSLSDKLVRTLFRQDFDLPWELKNFTREGHVIGAISPQTASEYLKILLQLSYTELDEAFDQHMPMEMRKRCQIAQYSSEQVFTGYLKQWEELFKYALNHKAGVLLHCG